MSDFVFKHFTVRQQHSAMKIGTDSVLLGCLVEINHSTRILDIGTGTGLLALMLAQRSNANIVAVEVDELAAMEATFNFKQSKWAHRITLHHKSIQQFSKEQHPKFDLIVSNPPYYAIQQHSAIAQKTRSIARHTNLLSFDELAESILLLLNPNGSCWLILPVDEGKDFAEIAASKGLILQHQINIKPKADKDSNRVVLQFGFTHQMVTEQTFIVYEADGNPTKAYKSIAADFYIGKQFSINNAGESI